MTDDDLFNFMMEGGDELLNSEVCPHCGEVIYLDQKIEWVDKSKGILKCPKCGEAVEV